MLGRGEFAHLVLITKIKATEITCFLPKVQIPKYSFSMHWKCFHALNCSKEVIKMSVSFLKRSERTSRQQATEAVAVLPWFPSFNFQRAAGAMSTHQSPQGITSSSCFGEEIKRMWAVPQEPQCNTEAPFFQSSNRREPLTPCEKRKSERLTSEKLQKSKFPLRWVGVLPVIYWIGQFPFQTVSIFWKNYSFHVRQEPAFSKTLASLKESQMLILWW